MALFQRMFEMIWRYLLLHKQEVIAFSFVSSSSCNNMGLFVWGEFADVLYVAWLPTLASKNELCLS
jgi:hypothetical protein